MEHHEIDLNDPDALTPVEIALNPALADAFDQLAGPGWPDRLPGAPV